MNPKLAPNLSAVSLAWGSLLIAGAFLVPFVCSGCAVHYYSASTGTEHLWGFGHLKTRAVSQRGDQPPFTNAVGCVWLGGGRAPVKLETRSEAMMGSHDPIGTLEGLIAPAECSGDELPGAIAQLFSGRAGGAEGERP
jgi:hypothetical protein